MNWPQINADNTDLKTILLAVDFRSVSSALICG